MIQQRTQPDSASGQINLTWEEDEIYVKQLFPRVWLLQNDMQTLPSPLLPTVRCGSHRNAAGQGAVPSSGPHRAEN